MRQQSHRAPSPQVPSLLNNAFSISFLYIKCIELSVAAAVSAARCALRLPDSDAMMNPSAAAAASSLYQYRITGYYWLIRVFVWGIQSSRSCGSIRSGR